MSKWIEVDQDKYNYGLECLPPRVWRIGHGFLVGEPSDHRECAVSGNMCTTYPAMFEHAGKYYAGKSLTLAEFNKVQIADVIKEANDGKG